MPYDVAHAVDLPWEEREPMYGQAPRSQASITEAAKLTESRARMWRYPAHTRGRRHRDPDQEEVYIPLAGSAQLVAGEDSFDLEPGMMIRVGPAQQRRIVPGPDGVRFIALGGRPGAFEHSSWTELGAPPPQPQ